MQGSHPRGDRDLRETEQLGGLITTMSGDELTAFAVTLWVAHADAKAGRVSAARRRTIGTKVSKSTGFGTCRSKPAAIAAATSIFEA